MYVLGCPKNTLFENFIFTFAPLIVQNGLTCNKIDILQVCGMFCFVTYNSFRMIYSRLKMYLWLWDIWSQWWSSRPDQFLEMVFSSKDIRYWYSTTSGSVHKSGWGGGVSCLGKSSKNTFPYARMWLTLTNIEL